MRRSMLEEHVPLENLLVSTRMVTGFPKDLLSSFRVSGDQDWEGVLVQRAVLTEEVAI